MQKRNKVVFFSNKSGVGTTTSVYHVAWMMAEMGYTVLAVDLDPQCTLTSLFLTTSRMEDIALNQAAQPGIIDAIEPVDDGRANQPVSLETISSNLYLLAGSLALSTVEDKLNDAWARCLTGDISSFKITSVFSRLFGEAEKQCNADWVLVDVGPSLGALNRTILISSDFVVLPVAKDVPSLLGLKNIGTILTDWRDQWAKRKINYQKDHDTSIPTGLMHPIGYVHLQNTAKDSLLTRSNLQRYENIPLLFQEYISKSSENETVEINQDKNCLAQLKHYHSLAAMSVEAKKPMFLLKPADGALGAHLQAVKNCYNDFRRLTTEIISRCHERFYHN